MTPIDSERRKTEPTPQEAQKDGQSAISQNDPTLELDEGGSKNHEDRVPQGSLPSGPLSDQQIAILCDIGGGRQIKEKHQGLVRGLVGAGFLESASNETAGYKLTGKAQDLVAQRGAGLNEA
jgi:hypothetical protein